jgi:hypothetical protein
MCKPNHHADPVGVKHVKNGVNPMTIRLYSQFWHKTINFLFDPT